MEKEGGNFSLKLFANTEGILFPFLTRQAGCGSKYNSCGAQHQPPCCDGLWCNIGTCWDCEFCPGNPEWPGGGEQDRQTGLMTAAEILIAKCEAGSERWQAEFARSLL